MLIFFVVFLDCKVTLYFNTRDNFFFFLFLDRINKIYMIFSLGIPIFENANTLFPKSFNDAPIQ